MFILADESVDYRIIRFLRLQSYNVLAIIDNDASITDIEVLEKANEHNALLLTEDKDFGELVFRSKLVHKGILLLRFQEADIDAQNKKVYQLLENHHSQLTNNFSVLSDKKLRIRKAS